MLKGVRGQSDGGSAGVDCSTLWKSENDSASCTRISKPSLRVMSKPPIRQHFTAMRLLSARGIFRAAVKIDFDRERRPIPKALTGFTKTGCRSMLTDERDVLVR